MIKKEKALRGKGAFFRVGSNKRKEDKWRHKAKWGWVSFAESIGNILVAKVQSRKSELEWQMLDAYIGFLYRHFSKEIETIVMQLEKSK